MISLSKNQKHRGMVFIEGALRKIEKSKLKTFLFGNLLKMNGMLTYLQQTFQCYPFTIHAKVIFGLFIIL